MALVDFSSQAWADLEAQGTILCDVGGPGNSVTDPAGVTFLIGEGSMRPSTVIGRRTLFYTDQDCAGTGHSPHPATLVIRFATGHQRVVLRMSESPPTAQPPKLIWFYGEHGRLDEIEHRSMSHSNAFHTVHYDRPCFPVKEIVIRSAGNENTIDYVEFGPTQVYRFLRRVYCLIARLGLRLRDLVVRRQPPVFNWEKDDD